MVTLVPSPRPGAPHLARFSRDVGYHCTFPLTLESSDAPSGLGEGTRSSPRGREFVIGVLAHTL